MKRVHYTKYTGDLASEIDLEGLLQALSNYLLDSGFSAADINLGWGLEMSEARGRLRSRPALQAYLARLRNRAGYKRAIEVGGPQDLSVFSAGVV